MTARVIRTLAAVSLITSSALLEAQQLPSAETQMAAAVHALPKEMRDGAGVMGYRVAGKLELLRPARNGMLCLADDPSDDQFHVSCYADTMDPFMARGRQLRAQGVTGAQVDSVRFREARAGSLKLPTQPAALYQLFGPKGAYDAATNTVKEANPLFVVYIPYATPATTGLSTTPSDTKPWLMFPGTPKAHIMFSHSM
jgi:hypothetical protein